MALKIQMIPQQIKSLKNQGRIYVPEKTHTFNSTQAIRITYQSISNAMHGSYKRHLIHFCHRMNPDHYVNWILTETSGKSTE